jgi:integrase/recombinase XerD
MSKSKKPSRLACAIARFLTHKRALGHRVRQATWLLPALRLAIVLLYTCGLRLGELLRVTIGDVEQEGTVLRIRESKFHKSRLVPLSVSTTRELQTYRQQRRRVLSEHPSAPLLCNRHGGHLHPYSTPGLEGALVQLFEASPVRDERGRRPRVHDLRHHSERRIIPSGA